MGGRARRVVDYSRTVGVVAAPLLLLVGIFGTPQRQEGGCRERVATGKAEKRRVGRVRGGARAVGGVWHAESIANRIRGPVRRTGGASRLNKTEPEIEGKSRNPTSGKGRPAPGRRFDTKHRHLFDGVLCMGEDRMCLLWGVMREKSQSARGNEEQPVGVVSCQRVRAYCAHKQTS